GPNPLRPLDGVHAASTGFAAVDPRQRFAEVGRESALAQLRVGAPLQQLAPEPLVRGAVERVGRSGRGLAALAQCSGHRNIVGSTIDVPMYVTRGTEWSR